LGTILFDTTTLPDGPHSFEAVVEDGKGNSATALAVTQSSTTRLPW